MKALFLLVVLFSSSTLIVAQKLPEWYRVYTFDESMIEMNTSNLITGGDIGRVTFRWTLDRPETLKRAPQLKYKSRLETIEFKCLDQRYRYYEVSLVDSAGKTIRSQLMSPPYEWREIRWGSVIATMSIPACELITRKLDPEETKRKLDEANDSDKVVIFARSIKDALERSKDFKPIIENYFAADFINRYLDDTDTNWFYNLNRETASRASRAELQRFYTAQLNAGYLTALYFISQSPADAKSSSDDSVQKARLVPADIYQLLNDHPYTLAYKAKEGSYDYLAENIDSVERMRSYTDLLEKIAELMRRHVTRVQADRSAEYKNMLEDSDIEPRICSDECFGLPQGTKLYQFSLPLLHLQFAEIAGKLKVVSATDSSH